MLEPLGAVEDDATAPPGHGEGEKFTISLFKCGYVEEHGLTVQEELDQVAYERETERAGEVLSSASAYGMRRIDDTADEQTQSDDCREPRMRHRGVPLPWSLFH